MEGLGYNRLIFALNAEMWAVQHPILNFGSEEQRRKYLVGGEEFRKPL